LLLEETDHLVGQRLARVELDKRTLAEDFINILKGVGCAFQYF